MVVYRFYDDKDDYIEVFTNIKNEFTIKMGGENIESNTISIDYSSVKALISYLEERLEQIEDSY